jgi:hypothetical protein
LIHVEQQLYIPARLPMRNPAVLTFFWVLLAGCSPGQRGGADLAPDHTVTASSKYPPAVDPMKVGSYPAVTKSGAGYFYDDVLEYRVWIHPWGGGDDYYRAFASYEPALKFSKRTAGAEEPLVLVIQKQWINEPEPGKIEARSGERITEWQTAWLSDKKKRAEDSIERFLREKGTSPR